MSDSQSIEGQETIPDIVIFQFLRQLLSNRQNEENVSVPDSGIFENSLSDHCYRVKDGNTTSLKGSEFELGCRGISPRRKSIYSTLRQREFLFSQANFKYVQQYTTNCIPNAPGLYLSKSSSRIYVSQYSEDGTIFYIATQDGNITLYSVPTFTPIQCIHAAEVGWAVISCSLNKPKNLLVYSTWSPFVFLYHVDDPASTPFSIKISPKQQTLAIFDTAFSNDSCILAAACSDGYVNLCDVEKLIRIQRVVAHEDHANACVFLDQSSNLLLSGGEDGLIRLWDTRRIVGERENPVASFPGHMDSVTSLDVHFDERHFLSNSKDQTAKLWDVRKPGDSCAVERTKTVVSRQSWDYRYEPPPDYLSDMRLYGDCSICSYTGHKVRSTLIRARFSPPHTTASKYIYTGSHGGKYSKAHVYDILTCKLVAMVGSHSSLIRDLSWHPYQLWLNTSSWDGSCVQWKYVPNV